MLTDTTPENQEFEIKRFPSFLQSVWRELTKPSSTIKSETEREHVRILLSISLIFIFFSSLSIFTTIFLSPDVIHIVIISMFLLIAIYMLARTRYVRLAAYAFALIPPLAITSAVMLPGLSLMDGSTRAALYNAGIGIVLAGLIMNIHDLRRYLAILIIWFALTLFVDQYPLSEVINLGREFFFLTITGIVTYTGTHQRLNYLRRLEVALEETRQAKKEVELANEARMTFFASMSHELRTPLNAIQGFSHFLTLDQYASNPEKVKDFARRIEQSGHQLIYLVNDLLDISAMMSGSLNLHFEDDVRLSEIIRAVNRNIVDGLLIEHSSMDYRCDFDSILDMPPMIADSKRIGQILNNLISNAFKFTEEGSIYVSAIYEADESKITISVADTGIGIPEDEQPHVFKPFKQAVDAIRVGNGTGLGMPISQYLTEAHGGTLTFESESGKGTTFYCQLPVKPPSHLLEKYSHGGK